MAFDKAKAVHTAEKYLAQGKIASAVQEYRRIVDADPDDFTALNTLGDLYAQNAEIRLRLAEGFMREVMHDEAAEAFAEAGTRLQARNDYQGALKAFTMAHDLRPTSHAILQGLVDANLSLGATEEAAAV